MVAPLVAKLFNPVVYCSKDLTSLVVLLGGQQTWLLMKEQVMEFVVGYMSVTVVIIITKLATRKNQCLVFQRMKKGKFKYLPLSKKTFR